ncbi:AraC family transcriptional regulator [Nostoc sp. UCD121]|uniref:AraC family transcriptional regulator n=1 Tax=unclassified Nostoc TaxID=2593658 RepID=UPI001625872F|nr:MULTISPECIES: AraC family transcriptional regulator [unclassified Nostoc]MBC1221650.1 AraC family transcriptional regulator [Nostoc sp. UCD120]MBC1274642.1 AraC family transcriptional regulator [Nostoc sp. UCD121]MBC1297101.1 AraC family transcriptional regulator [Nostoc sp. UCD122]
MVTSKIINQVINQSAIAHQCQELAALVTRHTDGKGDGFHQTAIEQLEFQRESSASTSLQGVCEPIFAILVQGKKEALLGEETYRYGAAQYLVVSVDLPLSAFIVEATPEQPYLGFKLNLDPRQLCDIITAQTSVIEEKKNSVRGLFVSTIDAPLLDCAMRLTRLLDTPQDIPILAPMIIREIYYRLLMGEQGEAVRQIATSGSNMQRIAEVIKLIKADFTKPMRVEELAGQASMSSSSFHHHFKKVTSMSPLQYQKQLRLLEARRLMLAENSDAANAAYQVGYESPSQFSREYSRMFGAPPIRDIERLRTA